MQPRTSRSERETLPLWMGWALGVSGLLSTFFMAFVLVLTLFYAFADGASTIALLISIAFGILATIVGIRIIRIHGIRG